MTNKTINIIAAGPSDGPSIPTASALFTLANEIEFIQDQHSETLPQEHWETLTEMASAMKTLGELVRAESIAAYIASRYHQAIDELEAFQST